MKKSKRGLKVFGIILAIVVMILLALFIKGKIDECKPYLTDFYYEDFKSNSPLEMKYSQRGSFETKSVEYNSDNTKIKSVRVWYPIELEVSDKTYPLILVVNASGTRALNYKPYFDRLASWGFIVVGNDDPQTGSGETASQTLDFILSLGNGDMLFNKIDKDNIGIVGYSQGGAGALCAVTKYENSSMYKTIFTGSAAYSLLAKNMGWEYDVTKISASYFMTAGTGSSDDAGVSDISKEFAGVAPLSSLIENYNGISDNVTKVRARTVGAEHEDMLTRTDGYMTAWMMYQLQGDMQAGTVFFGDNTEILHNSNWQDVQIGESDQKN